MSVETEKQLFLDYICALRADTDIPQWSGYMPDKQLGGGQLFFELHPVIRALMIADGTVTMAIEAIYREPIDVIVKHQAMQSLPQSNALLNVAANKELYYRQVELKGKNSAKCYVKAYSLIKREALNENLWRKLKNKEVGMGVVLRSAAQGSFRKVLHIGRGGLEQGKKNDKSDSHVHRTYSVNINDRPCMLITEVFDLKAFESGYS